MFVEEAKGKQLEEEEEAAHRLQQVDAVGQCFDIVNKLHSVQTLNTKFLLTYASASSP